MATSHSECTRTKLRSKAPAFRPSIGSSSTISSAGPVGAYSSTDLDSSTGSVGSWANGQFLAATPQTIYAWSASEHTALRGRAAPFAPDSQGASSSAQGGGEGEFRLGDFRSKLLKHAQKLASQETPSTSIDAVTISFENSWSGDAWIKRALLTESFAGPLNSSGKGFRADSAASHAANERRKAMALCQCTQRLQPSEPRESKGVPAVPLQHAATFSDGPPAKKESQETDALPVKRTFIHFSDTDGPKDSGFQWSSAPAIMLKTDHRTKYPEMEAAHIRGECRPCFYNTKKSDGCRHGGDCEFCHLCPIGSVQKKRKEKVKALRDQEALDKALDRHARHVSSYRSYDNDDSP